MQSRRAHAPLSSPAFPLSLHSWYLSLGISFSLSVLRKRHAPLDFRAEGPVGKLKEMHEYFYAYTHALCINKIEKNIRDGAHVGV
jgi:hypothetical protein